MWLYCSEREGNDRAGANDIHPLECTPETSSPSTPARLRLLDATRAVRKFVRSDGTERHNIYPPRTLEQLSATVTYLGALWSEASEACPLLPLPGTSPLGEDKDEDEDGWHVPPTALRHFTPLALSRVALTYSFLMDRLSAVRQELLSQHTSSQLSQQLLLLLNTAWLYNRSYYVCTRLTAAISPLLPTTSVPASAVAGVLNPGCLSWYDRRLHEEALASCLQRAAETAGEGAAVQGDGETWIEIRANLDDMRACGLLLQLLLTLRHAYTDATNSTSTFAIITGTLLAHLGKLPLAHLQSRLSVCDTDRHSHMHSDGDGSLEGRAWAMVAAVSACNPARALTFAHTNTIAEANALLLCRLLRPYLQVWRLALADCSANKREAVSADRLASILALVPGSLEPRTTKAETGGKTEHMLWAGRVAGERAGMLALLWGRASGETGSGGHERGFVLRPDVAPAPTPAPASSIASTNTNAVLASVDLLTAWG